MADLSLTCTSPRPQVQTAPKVDLGLASRIFGVWRQRQHLSRLPAHMRRDIGLSDVEIDRETARPIWDVPQTWRL